MSSKLLKNFYFFLFLIVLAGFFFYQESQKSSSQYLQTYFFDVGQGDAAYLRTPDNLDILIDGGPDAIILSKLGKVMPFFDRKIELVILSHPQADHLTGLIDVAKRYEISKVIWNKNPCETNLCQEWSDLLQEKNIYQIAPPKNSQLNFGQINIKFPYAGEAKDVNDQSILAKVIFGKNTLFFTGDAGIGVEEKLVKNKIDLRAQVLKVGHHGSKHGSSQNFLEKVNPYFAIISVGAKNRYGHPTQEVLKRLKNLKIDFFRTDIDFDIKCLADGQNVDCQKFN